MKAKQLGMNPSTASGRLVKDVLFKFVSEAGHKCFQCGGGLTRETFSLEHKTPWLHTDEPVKNYFDLDNIAFSHKSCNSSAARHPHKVYKNKTERQTAYRNRRKLRDPDAIIDIRRKKYLRTGT